MSLHFDLIVGQLTSSHLIKVDVCVKSFQKLIRFLTNTNSVFVIFDPARNETLTLNSY